MTRSLLKDGKFTTIIPGDTGLAATDTTGVKFVDMANFRNVIFISTLTETSAACTTGTFQLQIQHSSATASTSFTSLTTALVGTTAVTTAMWDGSIVADIANPTQRYLTAKVLKTGADTLLRGPVIAIQYNPKQAPTTQLTTSMIDSEFFNAPTT